MVDTRALVKLIEILEPLLPEDRLRNINAALTALGDPSVAAAANPAVQEFSPAGSGGAGHHPPEIAKRLQQSNIPADQADRVFAFHDDGTFGIITVPGKTAKGRSFNAYVLYGLGNFLVTGKYDFADAHARETCKRHGCYDDKNHATNFKTKHPAFIAKGGDWAMTIPGIKEHGAALVKEIAQTAAAKS